MIWVRNFFQEFVHLFLERSSDNQILINEILQELSLDQDGNLEEIDFKSLFIMTEILKGYFSPYLSPNEHLKFYDGYVFPDHFSFEITTGVPKKRESSNLLQFLFNDEFRFP